MFDAICRFCANRCRKEYYIIFTDKYNLFHNNKQRKAKSLKSDCVNIISPLLVSIRHNEGKPILKRL